MTRCWLVGHAWTNWEVQKSRNVNVFVHDPSEGRSEFPTEVRYVVVQIRRCQRCGYRQIDKQREVISG